jgi:hypothetical protein
MTVSLYVKAVPSFIIAPKRNCKLEHMLNWFNMLIDMHNNRIISLYHTIIYPSTNKESP